MKIKNQFYGVTSVLLGVFFVVLACYILLNTIFSKKINDERKKNIQTSSNNPDKLKEIPEMSDKEESSEPEIFNDVWIGFHKRKNK
ncbi:hypothetical protein TUBRATIS_008220 [Tubulinosema ratisbonensis]|uniref:Uncharacterized protein n=1 Tax=Tubulinosema ratisbonensis TaxID=291195 RepID=A0A437ANQ6_9MICR|nr:hypothetical protein TUBRATIS_008220 [Tubulinosema ratisbonensis]